jgi:hypothetical protein
MSIVVINVTEHATLAVNAGQITSGTAIGRDGGLQENIRLLHELSEELDGYFAMRTLGEFPAEG